MKKTFRRMLSLVLVFVLCISGAGAYSSPFINTKFDAMIWLTEENSLFTEDKEMSDEERAQINSHLEKHPEDFGKCLNEYLASLDSHSMYLPKAEYESGFSTLVSYVGVGVEFRQTPEGYEITRVFRAGGAAKAGVRIGDYILSIDGRDVTGLPRDDVAALMRGAENTEVCLGVQRGEEKLEMTIVRTSINNEYVDHMTVSPGIEYVSVSAMGSQADLDTFREIWDGLDEKRTQAVILDLRSNGGGLIDVAYGMVDTVLEKYGMKMGAQRFRKDHGGLQEHLSSGGGLPLNRLCVLVDGNTASAAELMTAALKHAGAEVIGAKTYGKGQGQVHIPVAGGARLVVTVLEMLDPDGVCWEGKGILPTIPIEGNRPVEELLADMPDLDEMQPLRYGQQSENVRALSGRLYLMGFAHAITDVFDTEVLSAMRRYQKEVLGKTPTMMADIDLLHEINDTTAMLVAKSGMVDCALAKAVELSREAIRQPMRYSPLPTGGWTAA